MSRRQTIATVGALFDLIDKAEDEDWPVYVVVDTLDGEYQVRVDVPDLVAMIEDTNTVGPYPPRVNLDAPSPFGVGLLGRFTEDGNDFDGLILAKEQL